MKFFAIGRVYPERADVNISKIEWEKEGSKISVFCRSSQLFVVLDDPRVAESSSAHATAEHVCQVFVSALGFVLGCAYKVEITQVVDEDFETIVVGVQQPEVSFGLKDEAVGDMFAPLLERSRHDLFLRFAIHDYTSAIVDKLGCAMLCYRAVESLAKSLSGGGTGNTNWSPMHSKLGTTKDEIEGTITVFAKPIRHGNWAELKPMSIQERMNALLLTRSIIVRYLDYSDSPEV